MKKMKAGKRSSVAPKNVDEYLAGVPEPARSTLNELRATIRSVMPSAATETISYGMPAFLVNGQAVAALLAGKQHCSYFPMSGRVVASLAKELRNYNTSKGTIRFPPNKPPPSALVKRLVKARIAELGNSRRPHRR